MAADVKQLPLFEDTRLLHPKWGYDLDAVPQVRCMYCDEYIGDEEYVEFTMFARFGDMMFLHRRCKDECDEITRRRRRSRSKGESV